MTEKDYSNIITEKTNEQWESEEFTHWTSLYAFVHAKLRIYWLAIGNQWIT
jgi:hypothetical protein